MRFRRWQPVLVCLIVVALVLVGPVRRGRARAASSYTVTDLGTLGGSQSKAFGINSFGQVVGDSLLVSGASHPFFWSAGTGMFDLGTLGGDSGSASGVNINGSVVGNATIASGETHAFIWHDDNGNHQRDAGEMKDLGTLSGDSFSTAVGINSTNTVVGFSEDENTFTDRAFTWHDDNGNGVSDAGEMKVVAASGGLTPIAANAIDDNGEIVGVATTSGALHAYRLSGGTMTDIPPQGAFHGNNSFAFGINQVGDFVGDAEVQTGGASPPSHALLWTTGVGMTDLGVLSGGSNSIAYGISHAGIVGSSEVSVSSQIVTHAFVVPIGGTMTDLNSLIPSGTGWTLQEARAINDGGQIVGYGTISGQTHAFLLTPTDFTQTSISNVSGSAVFGGTATLTATLNTGNAAPNFHTISFTLNGAAVCGVSGKPVCPVTNANGVATLSGVDISGINAGTPNAVVATFAGDPDISASTGTGNLVISKADQTITFGALTNKTFGDPDFTVTATATSGLPVSFSAGVNDQCTVSGNTVHITGAGNCTITASQGGNTNFNPAPNVSQSFTIAKASQSITFGALGNKTFGDADFNVSATATSGLSVSFSATGNCTVTGSSVHITGAGSCTVTASQAGDSNFKPAADVAQTFQIVKAATTTAVSSSANPSTSGQSVTFSATVTASAGTPTGTVQFKIDGNNFGSAVNCASAVPLMCVAQVSTSALSFGTHTVTADYSGDSNFSASSGTLSGGQTVGGTVIQFAQSNYTVSERGGSITINVKRTGDTAGAVSVNYFTDDGSTPSVAVPCSSVTGLALERCDYTRAAGTLSWAAGDTADKTFIVLVNDDSYPEGDETLSLRLSNPVGSVLGAQSSATLTITDDSPESSGNPVDDSSFFVRQHYHDFLNREPDTDGLNFWTGGIESCGANQQCRDVKRINTSAAFFLSIEFQETGYLVERIYKTAFGDATGNSSFPGPHQLAVPVVRLNEFLLDTQRIGSTPTHVIVNQGDWQNQLEANKQAFVLDFVSRQRFAGLLALTPAQYVDKLNQNAGSVLTQSQRDQLVSQLAQNDTPTARAAVLRSIAENPVLDANEKNRAFVLMQFFGYLRRNPDDAQDTDYTGYDFWLQKLNQFNGDFVKAEMVKAFITSIEYRQRFGQP